MHCTPLGDRALLVTLGETIDDATHQRVRAALLRLDAAAIAGVTDLVPTFTSVAIHYDPALLAADDRTSPYTCLVTEVEGLLAELREDALPESPVVEIPVCYGGDLGPDLDELALRHGLLETDVVTLHSGPEYRVHMIGFMPGFAYLGGLPDVLATPRRDTPRTTVPAGSVGIGGQQTGVYPMESPGGWHLIGRTPLRLFDPAREPASLLAAGDRVRFRAIDSAEYRELAP